MNIIRNVRMNNNQIDKTPDKTSITSSVRKRITIRRTKRNIKRHRSHNSTLITESGPSKKVLIQFFGNKEFINNGGDLNPKKITKQTKIRYKMLLTQMGHILRIITSILRK